MPTEPGNAGDRNLSNASKIAHVVTLKRAPQGALSHLDMHH